MRWARRHRRALLAVAAAIVAPVLASRDHRVGWTVLVAVVTSSLAAASVWADYAADPGRAERRAAREREQVRAILYRYETGGARPPRADRRAARDRARVEDVLRRNRRGDRQQAAVDEILARYERRRSGAR